jgi:uncharacterized membrane protein
MTSKQSLIATAIGVAFIGIAVLSRILPHPFNFTPLTAIALFGGVYFSKRLAFVVPMAALLISDSILGFHSTMPWVYGSFLAAGLIGYALRGRKSVLSVSAGTLASSILFFVVTNFGVWASGSMYMHSWAGLLECYTAAIPFFRNSFAGDVVFVAAMFGLYEVSLRLVASRAQEASAR